MSVVVSGIELNKEQADFSPDIIVSSAKKLFEDGAIKINQQNCRNMGIFLGTTFSNFNVRASIYKNYADKGLRAVNPAEFPKGLISYLSGYLSIKLNIRGMNSTLSSGCSSGLDALAQAMHFLSRDKANKALVIELAEEFSREAVCAGDKNVCLVLENSSSDKKPGYGRILAFESFFEKKGQRQGLNKALRLALEGCGLDHSELQDENCISEPYLFTIGQTLKLKPDKTTANMMFLALGQDNNSSCLIVKLPKPEEAKREP